MRWLTILLICLNLNNAIADVVFLDKNKPAPFSGYLFGEEEAQNARNAVIDRDRYRLLSDSLQHTVNLQSENIKLEEKRVELYKTKTDELAKELYSARTVNNWERVGWFILGIAATTAAGYAISHVSR
jgi:hypothetical protein